MLCSKRSNLLVNYAFDRYLRVIYDGNSSFYFEIIMAKKKPVIHQHKNQTLMKEMYKFENDLSSPLIDDIFEVLKNTLIKTWFRDCHNCSCRLCKTYIANVSYV